MVNIVVLKIPDSQQYHFGDIQPEGERSHLPNILDYPPSDLIFSALMNIWQNIYGNADDLRNFFEDKISISSGAYVISSQDYELRFLPKPVISDLFNSLNHKVLKKIEWVSEEIIRGGILPQDWLNEEKCKVIDGQFLCLAHEAKQLSLSGKEKFSVKVELPKVKVHDEQQIDGGNYYHQTNLRVTGNLGNSRRLHYYFYIDHQMDEANWQKMKTCLNILPDEGLGGDRSAGAGKFAGVDINYDVQLPRLNEKGHLMSLSLCSPLNQEEFEHAIFYRLRKRGGRYTLKNGRLKIANMMMEGAIFNNTVKGNLVDISPDNDKKYIRNGKAFLIPLHSNFTSLWNQNDSK